MCKSCGVSGCSCNKKRHCSAVDQVLVPGPQGPAGQDGNDGAVGPQGPPGSSGGLDFEHWFTTPLDILWNTVETVQPEFNHTVTADGNYQISGNLRVSVGGSGFNTSGFMRLYINGVQVDQLDVSFPNIGILPPGERVILDTVFFWRGAMLNGQTIEIRHEAGVNSFIGSVHGSMLVNKEP
jgi:hypothetical protein